MPKPTRLTRGSVAFARALQARNWNKTDAETHLGLSLGMAGRYLRGQRRPGRQIGARFHSELGIPPEWWDEPTKGTAA